MPTDTLDSAFAALADPTRREIVVPERLVVTYSFAYAEGEE
jgi:hypothetical protein